MSDRTYVWTQEGWVYVAVLLDLWSRCVAGWVPGTTLYASLAGRALQMATRHRSPGPGLLHHSDRGMPYASGEYRAQLQAAGMGYSGIFIASPI